MFRNKKDQSTTAEGVVLRTELTQQAIQEKCLLELQQRLDENVEDGSKDGSYEVKYCLVCVVQCKRLCPLINSLMFLGCYWQSRVDVSQCCTCPTRS